MILQNVSLRLATRPSDKRRDKIDGPVNVIIRILDHLTETHPTDHGVDYWFEEERLWAYQDPSIQVHEFRFNNVDWMKPGSINREQAQSIAKILIEANKNNHNVLVHCVQGESRSAAVVKAALQSFKDATCPTEIPWCNNSVCDVIKYEILRANRREDRAPQ